MVSERRRTPRLGVIAPVVLLVAVIAAAIAMLQDGGKTPDPVALSADGLTFTTLEALFEASDLVVEGGVDSIESGRTISDPANPDAGLVTSLSSLDVEAVFKGDAIDVIVVEQEVALLDGTPIVVNGLVPNEVGDSGFWFLIRGTSDEFPYVALLNEQARLLVDDQQRVVDAPLIGPVDASQLRERLVVLGSG
jgi:hypothetical protein